MDGGYDQAISGVLSALPSEYASDLNGRRSGMTDSAFDVMRVMFRRNGADVIERFRRTNGHASKANMIYLIIPVDR